MFATPSLLVVLVLSSIGCINALDARKSYNLYHVLGNESKPTPRGTITIAPSDGEGSLVATYHPDESAQLDISSFDSMVDSGGLYTLLVLEEGDSPSNNGHHVSASVPGCSLRRSNLREDISLSLSPTGKLMSVSYRPLISPLAAKTCDKLKPLAEKPEAIFGRNINEDGGESSKGNLMLFKTTVGFEGSKPMMTIPTVLPQQTKPPPGLKWYRQNAKNNPNPLLGSNTGNGPSFPGEEPSGIQATFLYRIVTKYWYIVLPLFIMGMFGGVDEEPPKGGQVRGEGGGATGSSVEQRQRRGKRD
ncbi:predicted protein [Thalassiosira pseudonana CCMP1335]|uniref:ER membrane protein complex subunit 10 n=1 Tax=Thalassiosira pseudonana TaxID=35128 RepID=B8C019_THAPS|nr:predicted protein [Thalassiosira pseudonana CCMP1335]EED93442.1 predicted protein [Thalassiosira pseudonana CCMP1335]|eukprot:scaffold6263_cov192-Alexandrium_tamarense.AAC.14